MRICTVYSRLLVHFLKSVGTITSPLTLIFKNKMRCLVVNIAVLFRVLLVLVNNEEVFGFEGVLEFKHGRLHGRTNFEYIRKNKLLYIDKTGFAAKMLTSNDVFYFIARPRKFGKSLFCRTLESLSWGNKDLFHDLAIAKSTYDWEVHPVIYLDFSGIDTLYCETSLQYATAIVDELKTVSNAIRLHRREKIVNPEVKIHASPGRNKSAVRTSLTNLVESLNRAFSSTTTIIIDEYDSGLTSNLKNPEVSGSLSVALREFYGCIKSLETELNFVFITGVARFTQAYLFSSMNNLRDISSHEDFSDILGFTEKEMKFFAPEIEDVVKHRKETWGENVTISREMSEIQARYHGYKFTANGPSMFHPSFLMTYLQEKEHDAVKNRIPAPQYLLELLPRHLQNCSELLMGINATVNDLSALTDPRNLKLAALLFQTGIFSIQKYDRDSKTYFLRYPNQYLAEHFEREIIPTLFKTLIAEPLDWNLDFKRFDEQCNGMMNDLVVGDEYNVKKYFEKLDILATQRGYSTFPTGSRPSGKKDEQEEDRKTSPQTTDQRQNVKEVTEPQDHSTTLQTKRGRGRPKTSRTTGEKVTKRGRDRPTSQVSMQSNSNMEDYYFKLEGAFQYMLRICLHVCKIGRVNYEREFCAGRNNVEYLIPKLSKILLFETKVGHKDLRDALNQLLTQYATAYLNNGRNLICIAVSFSKTTRRIEDWIYVEYNEKGQRMKFFSLKGHDASTVGLYDFVSIT